MGRRAARSILSALAVGGLALAAQVTATTPAQAYTCSGGQSVNIDAGVASASLTFYPRCSDGRSHWSGVIRDTRCDARSGKIMLTSWAWVGGHAYQANNGCGTSSSFSGSDRALSSPWEVWASVGACNSTSCSGYYTRYLQG
jgi:hypothetical protein